MIPTEAVIKSPSKTGFSSKIFGQNLMERSIRILSRAGVKKIYLELDGHDREIFRNEVEPYVKNLNVKFSFQKHKSGKKTIAVQSNHFLMFRAFSSFEKNFSETNGVFTPKKTADQMPISSQKDYAKAKANAVEVIRTGSGGKIAQNINKRLSIPISLLLARFRVSPNLITVINFFIGVSGVALLCMPYYAAQLCGGFLFQACSVIDGCDGEVARMTTRFSKLGGLLDTLSDQIVAALLVVFFVRTNYAFFPGEVFIAWLAITVFGLTLTFGTVIYFVRFYTTSMSLAAFSREFVDLLPKSDPVVKFFGTMQYITRKELYSMMVFAAAAAGLLPYLGIFLGCILFIAPFFLAILLGKYLRNHKKVIR